MPLTATFSWRQTPREVILDVPLKGCSPDSLDVTVADLIVKVSFAPYLLLVDLLREVSPEGARLVLDRSTGTASIFLPKLLRGRGSQGGRRGEGEGEGEEEGKEEEEDEWEDLAVPLADADALAERREASFAREAERQRVASQARAASLHADERTALKAQMASEERQRAALESAQAAEKEAAQKEAIKVLRTLEDASAQQKQEARQQQQIKRAAAARQMEADDDAAMRAAAPTSSSSSSAAAPSAALPAARAAALKSQSALSGRGSRDGAAGADDALGSSLGNPSAPSVAPRAGGVVSVNFTPRPFPTPLRESKAKGEEDWLARNYLALKRGQEKAKAAAAAELAAAAAGRGAGPSSLAAAASSPPPAPAPFVERDPAWLKDKADGFARAGDWASAEAAYSAALESSPPVPEPEPLLLNRALARLHLDRGDGCVQDCCLVAVRVLFGSATGTGGGAAAQSFSTPATAASASQDLAAVCGAARAAAAVGARSGAGVGAGAGAGTGAGMSKGDGPGPEPGPGGGSSSASLHPRMVSALAPKARAQLLKALGRMCLARMRSGSFREASLAAGALLAVDAGREVGEVGAEEALAALARAEAHKAAGDVRVKAGDPEGALSAYDAALALADGRYVQALMNKAAALHGLGRWAECEAACAVAERLLAEAGPWLSARVAPDCVSPVPFAGTALHLQCRARAEARIADCRAKMAPPAPAPPQLLGE